MTGIKQVENIRTYYVRSDRRDWGYFFINNRGLFACHSDYGAFGYHWPVDEDFDFLKFLANTKDIPYILGKISRRDEVDEDRTTKAFQRHVLSLRREKQITKERARWLMDSIKRSSRETVRTFIDEVLSHPEFYNHDGYEMIRYDYPPGPKQLMENLFPILQEQLRKELAAKEEGVA